MFRFIPRVNAGEVWVETEGHDRGRRHLIVHVLKGRQITTWSDPTGSFGPVPPTVMNLEAFLRLFRRI